MYLDAQKSLLFWARFFVDFDWWDPRKYLYNNLRLGEFYSSKYDDTRVLNSKYLLFWHG